MKKLLRVGYGRYFTDAEFERFYAFAQKHRACIDQIALFTDYSHHPYYPMEELAELSRVLTKRIAKLRQLNMPVGINILDTIGHMDEAWDVLTLAPFQTLVGHDGLVAKSCMCPNTPEYKAYMREKYRLFSMANPDFIWVDDDIRMIHHTVSFACFCPTCMGIFNAKHGTNYTREALVAQLNSPDGQPLREKWAQQTSDTITHLLAMLSEVIKSVNPAIKIGLMTIGLLWQAYDLPDYRAWFGALDATMARPGGGYYSDDKTIDMIDKMLSCQRQIAHYPPAVNEVLYELENFPYQRLSKSIHVAMLECSTALMCGHDGVAFNVLPMHDYHELFDRMAQMTPYWNTLAKITENTHNQGVCSPFDYRFMTRCKVDDGNWFSMKNAGDAAIANDLAHIGVPFSMAPEKACCTVLAGAMAQGFDDEQLRQMLCGGVLMDGKSFDILTERGFGEYLGAQVESRFDNGACEVFTDSAFNGCAAGQTHDVFLTFWGKDAMAYTFKPKDGANPEHLCELRTILGEKLGHSAYVYENPYGGRVAVMGYMPWKLITGENKRGQYLRIFDWLSGHRLPVIINKCVKVVPYAKKSNTGDNMVLMLTNAFLDETGAFTVTARVAPHLKAAVLQQNGELTPVGEQDITRRENELEIRIENMQPWQNLVIHFYR